MPIDLLFYKMIDVATHVLNSYASLFALDDERYDSVGRAIPLPKHKESDILEMCTLIIDKMKSEHVFLQVQSPCVIVGDLHGNIVDLLRILHKNGPIESTKYVFLGDYVDRGDFSIQVIVLLMAMYLKYPDNVTLIRGNHEFTKINREYGLYEECMAEYENTKVWMSLNEAFCYFPIGCLIDENIFCIHGGLSDHMTKLEEINKLKKPISDFNEHKILYGLLWSDPDNNAKGFQESQRGNGVAFGRFALKKFMEDNNLVHIFRAHQCVRDGTENFANGLLITVFSSSNYCGMKNSGANLILADKTISQHTFEPIDAVTRSECHFSTIQRSLKSPFGERHCVAILAVPTLNSIKNKKRMSYSNCLLNTGAKLMSPHPSPHNSIQSPHRQATETSPCADGDSPIELPKCSLTPRQVPTSNRRALITPNPQLMPKLSPLPTIAGAADV